jgi:serine protease AprX
LAYGRSLVKIPLLAVLGFAFLALFFAASGEAQSDGPEVDPLLRERLAAVDGVTPVRAVLTYDERPSRAQVDEVRRIGVAVHAFDVLPMLGVQGTRDQIQELASLDGVASVYLDRPLDYLLHESRPLIGADRVESELGYTGEGVGVAVIDSGVDGAHPDVGFGDEMVQNVKILGDAFFTGATVVAENQTNTDTSSGHGTHVAGTVGGSGEASAGYYTGIAPGSDLVGIGAGDILFILYALEGFDYALKNQERYNIQVISNSWGTSGEFDKDDPINVASKLAHDRGMTVVFAAGNSGPEEDTLNPYSVAPWVIGVAAGNKDGETLADFSSRGRPGSDLYHPTLTAPGVDIVSARASTGATINALTAANDVTYIPPGYLPYYTTASGTSMATPHVSGAIALMEEADPGLTPDKAKKILVKTATEMPGYEEYEVGAGYLNAYKAVTRAAGRAAKKIKR